MFAKNLMQTLLQLLDCGGLVLRRGEAHVIQLEAQLSLVLAPLRCLERIGLGLHVRRLNVRLLLDQQLFSSSKIQQ
jgi:hypothetical protein